MVTPIETAITPVPMEPLLEANSPSELAAYSRSHVATYFTALDLYHLGLNVMPVLYGQKRGGSTWKRLQYTRLHRDALHLIFSGLCNIAVMCGRTSRNLFVIDCETQEAFAYHLNQTKKRGIPMFAVETSRGGHLWFFSADGEIENIEKGKMSQVEVRGSNRYVVCPPSLHPSGKEYRWLTEPELLEPPTVNLSQIDWLVDNAGRPIKLKIVRLSRTSTKSERIQQAERLASKLKPDHDPRIFQLSKQTLDYLECGSSLTPGTRNNRLFRAACDMLGCEFPAAAVSTLLGPIARASGLTPKEVEATLHSAASRTRTAARPKNSNRFTPLPQGWDYALAYIRTTEWPGRTYSTDKAIALALVERARLGSNEDGTFRGSLRDLGVLARRSNRQKISASLKRLQKRRFIVKARGLDKLSEASLWQFHPDMLQQGRQAVESGLCESEPLQSSSGVWGVFASSTNGYTNGSLSNRSTDAAERGALGAEGILIYQTMIDCGEPMYPKTIASKTRLTVGQVRYRLRGLRKYHLVEWGQAGWVVTQVLDAQGLDERVAAPAGKLGKGKQRKQRSAEEQARYAGLLILRWRERCDPNFLAEAYCCMACRCQFWSYLDQVYKQCPRCGSSRVRRRKSRSKAG
jgi:hypothetical protein